MRLIRIVVNFFIIVGAGICLVPIVAWMAASGDKDARSVLRGDYWFWSIP